MSLYLYQRLLAEGSLSRGSLLAAITLSVTRRASFVEALIVEDLRHARAVMDCFREDGEKADPAWRPAPRLLLDLPPGICEAYLAFPFRERAGAIEVATISPLDVQVREEFQAHLVRPVALFRASLQGLLAAAGAPVDLGALSHCLSEPPLGEDGPLPLVRKSRNVPKSRERMRTAPGIGSDAGSSFPPDGPFGTEPPPPSSWNTNPEERLGRARDPRELALSLGLLLLGPSLIFEIGGGRLHLRAMSPGGDCDDSPINVKDESCLGVAVETGHYMGPWYSSPIHDRFAHVFDETELVQIDRVGGKDSGLVVVRKVIFDGRDDGHLLARARIVWDQLKERATLFG